LGGVLKSVHVQKQFPMRSNAGVRASAEGHPDPQGLGEQATLKLGKSNGRTGKYSSQ